MYRNSEAYMASVFYECMLQAGHFGCFPNFSTIKKDFRALQGTPDFVATASNNIPNQIYSTLAQANNDLGRMAFIVLSNFCGASPRTEPFIVKKTNLATKEVKRTLNELVLRGILAKTETGSFKLSPEAINNDIDIWAFELKMKNWKRAIFQSLQAKSFANRVVIVLPLKKQDVVATNIDYFKKSGVGVMLFDPESKFYKTLLRPVRRKHASNLHFYYALAKLATP